jgi:hypothetical protein
MRKLKMKNVYLKVKYIGQGMFSNERLIEAVSSTGEVYEGLFQNGHMKGDSLVKVLAFDEGEDTFLVKVMHGGGCGFYGHGVEGYPYLTVKKDQVYFQIED